MNPFLKDPELLSPSKLGTFVENRYSFIKKYILREKPKTTDAMELGTLIHNTFYEMLTLFNGTQQHLSDFGMFIEMPVKWPTKAECGKTVADQRKEWLEMTEKKKLTILTKDTKEIYQAILRFLHTSTVVKNIQPMKKEFEKILSKPSFAGILDIYLPEANIIIDLKTFSKERQDFGKYNVTSLLWQQVMYERLVKSNILPQFFFLVIQTKWPFEVFFVQLPKRLVSMGHQLFPSILGEYDAFVQLLKESLGNPYKEKNEKEKIECLKQLKSFNLYDMDSLKTLDVKPWTYQEVRAYDKYKAVK